MLYVQQTFDPTVLYRLFLFCFVFVCVVSFTGGGRTYGDERALIDAASGQRNVCVRTVLAMSLPALYLPRKLAAAVQEEEEEEEEEEDDKVVSTPVLLKADVEPAALVQTAHDPPAMATVANVLNVVSSENETLKKDVASEPDTKPVMLQTAFKTALIGAAPSSPRTTTVTEALAAVSFYFFILL